MYLSPNRYAELHLAGMQSMMKFAHTQIEALQRLSALNLGIARSAFYGSLAAVGIEPDESALAGFSAVRASPEDAGGSEAGREDSQGRASAGSRRRSIKAKKRRVA
jgi:hypothetical protein